MMKEKEAVLDSTSSRSTSTSSSSGSAVSSSRGGNILNNAGDNNTFSPSSKMMIIPSSSISHHVLMPVGQDLEIDDMDNYQDIRIELNATGHNLVCTVTLYIFYAILCYARTMLSICRCH